MRSRGISAGILLGVLLLPMHGGKFLGQRENRGRTEPGRNVEQEVRAAIQGRLDAVARNDVAAWADFVADDMITPLEGAVPSKKAWIQARKSIPREVRYFYGPLEDFRVRVHGDTAVVTYRAKQYNEIGGQTTYFQSWQIETHVWQHGRWMLVAVADSVIAPEPGVAAIDFRAYDGYVGKYAWAPTLISTVSREGDRLMLELAGDKSELLPESETSFFVKGGAAQGDTGRYVFVKDAGGRVTHYVYREYGVTERVVKRVD